MDVLKTLLATGLLASTAAAAQAHVSADPAEAVAGAYQVVRFRVGHGCGDTAETTALRIEIPAGMKAARPQPKPGWTLMVERDGSAGSVRAVTWRGRLPAEQFDEFAVLFQLPDEPGVLRFPTIQTCGTTEARWTEAAPEGGPRPKNPAPAIRLRPAAAPEGGHHH